MNASLDAPSLKSTDYRTFIRVCCADGNQFELPAVNGIDVGAFMASIKAHGFIGHANWFVHYDAIVWAIKVIYRDDSPEAQIVGMTKQ